MFVQRLIELKYELMIENKHQELIKRIVTLIGLNYPKKQKTCAGMPNLTST